MATSSPPMSEIPPGGYDPSSATPYGGGRSGAGGQGGGPPQITAPPPSAVSQEPPPTAPSVLPGSKGAKAASIAYGLDAVLRGAMRGREQAQQQSAYKANKLIQGFQYAYKNASDQYLGMLQNDPALAAKLGELDKIGKTKNPTAEQQARAKEISSDPSVVKAQQVASAADSAWQAQQQMYNNYLNPQSGKKPKSGKSKGGDQSGDAQNPVMQIQSKDPMEKLQGYLAISKAAGPSYKREAAYYMSPEYQQSRANAVGEQQITSDIQGKRIELHKLQNADPATLDDKAKQRLEQLRTDPELFPSMSRPDKKVDTKITSDNHRWTQWQKPDGNLEWRDEGEQRGFASQIAKPGSEQEYVERIAKDSGISEKELSAESLKAIRQSWAASGQMGKVVSRNYVYTDKETGQIVVVPLTSTTTPVGGSKGVPEVHAGGSAASTASTSVAGSGGGPTATHSAAPHTAPLAGAGSGGSETPPDGSPAGARVIGHTLSGPKAKAQSTTADTYKKMKPLFDLLPAQEDYIKEIEKDPSKATPRQDLSLVVAAVRSMNPGSVRLPQKELELELKAGSYGDQANRWFENATKGTLPPDQRKDLFSIIKRETSKAGESIAADWQQNMSGQPLPEDIKRFAKQCGGAGGGPTNTPASGSSKLSPEQEKLLDQYFPH